MPIFEVRVERIFEAEYVDLEIEADNQDHAEDLALKEARVREDQYFGSRIGIEPSFEVSDINGDDN